MNTGEPFKFDAKPPHTDILPSPPPDSDSRREEEFQERLQLLIFLWIQAEIPLWQPERSPKYRQSSQALNAPIPGSANSPRGLVYFKNIFDPCWSDEDLARVRETAFPWMLMILNPCERFCEYESRFMELISNSQNLMIWRPDAPSPEELENLYRLIFTISPETLEGDPSGSSTINEVYQILEELYIKRGRLLSQSDPHSIGLEISDQSIWEYISFQLCALPLQKPSETDRDDRNAAEPVTNEQILEWAALITGSADLRNSSVAKAREQLIEWWMKSAEELSTKLTDLPEAFMTIRFRSDVKSVEGPLMSLKPIIHSLRAGTISMPIAINHLAGNFAWDAERLLQWKQSLDNFAGLMEWMPRFLQAQEYLRSAFLLGQKDLNHAYEFLIVSISEPCQFLEARARSEFDERFLDFKKRYMDSYYALHEDARQVMRGLRNDSSKIDPVALQNLELLSGLRYTDKSYLNRVKVLARWVQRNQCNLPLRQILDRYPRCLCNFNPCSNQPPADSAIRINTVIQEGIEYFRTILRKCDRLILEELNNQQTDNESVMQITNLLSHDSLTRLKPQPIKILNAIIGKHSRAFFVEIRNYRKPTRSSW